VINDETRCDDDENTLHPNSMDNIDALAAEKISFLERQNTELKGLLQLAFINQGLMLTDLPDYLQNDWEFLAPIVSEFDDHDDHELDNYMKWNELPKNLKENSAVACAFYRNNRTMCWYYLPYNLKIDKDVVISAIGRYCGGITWEKVPCVLQTNTEVLFAALACGAIGTYQMPKKDLFHSQPELAVFGIQAGLVNADEFTCLTRDVFRNAIAEDYLEWYKLPTSLRYDTSFARSINRFKRDRTPIHLLRSIPQMAEDASFWEKCFHIEDEDDDDEPFSCLLGYLPVSIRENREIMLQSLQLCTQAFVLVAPDLKSDPSFLEAALMQSPYTLQYLSFEVQRDNQAAIMKAARNISEKKVRNDFANKLCPSLWTDYDFAMNWVKSGHGFPDVLDGRTTLAWYDNHDLCLERVIHQHSIDPVSGRYCNDIAFMSNLLERAPELYPNVFGAAKFDQTVMTIAFSGDSATAESAITDLHLYDGESVIRDYLCYLYKQLEPYRTFVSCILGNMLSTQSMETTGTRLTLLNQGLETSTRYKKLLAEYLGILTGKRLCQLIQAERNVLRAITCWTPIDGYKYYKVP